MHCHLLPVSGTKDATGLAIRDPRSAHPPRMAAGLGLGRGCVTGQSAQVGFTCQENASSPILPGEQSPPEQRSDMSCGELGRRAERGRRGGGRRSHLGPRGFPGPHGTVLSGHG